MSTIPPENNSNQPTSDTESSDHHTAPTANIAPGQSSPLYVIGDDMQDDPFDNAASFVPFQPSTPLPPVGAQGSPAGLASTGAGPQPPDARGRRSGWVPSIRAIVMALLLLVVISTLALLAFVQLTPPVASSGKAHPSPSASTATTRPHPNPPASGPGATASPVATTTTGQVPAFDEVPQVLPAGWTNAGHSMADALQAERTALTFTDREMTLDYRNVGTRTQHGGTFTAAVFLLTQAARERFVQNDVRAANNELYDSIARRQLIQIVINAQPHLVQFAVAGQQQFAWVDVAFQFWRSQLTQAGQRVGGRETDPTTQQLVIHHMIVILLWVAPGTQGPNAPMGGTGWLVSNYALDSGAGLPGIVHPA
jgi:hypothetical protein